MSIATQILDLDIRFQPIAQSWQEMCRAYLIPARFQGYTMKVLETRRSLARQAEVLANGASKLKVGYHNFGLALDFAIFGEGGLYLKDGAHPAYLACGQVAEALGCVWGGRWATLKDSGHIEWHPPGQTLQDLINAAGLTA